MKFQIEQIGTIYTKFKAPRNMPIQPNGAYGSIARVKIFDRYIEGLKDLELFSHIFLFYIFHLSKKEKLRVIPFMDKVERGVFATRAPSRPNHIGISIVKIININKNTLEIEGADIVDGTPLIDIKPYIPDIDKIDNASSGWIKIDKRGIASKRSDSRFLEKS